MADRSLRGMRLGAQSLQSEEGVTFSPRKVRTYRVADGSTFDVTFSAEAEAPTVWESPKSRLEGRLIDDTGELVDSEEEDVKVARSHWDMLLERRTREELEEVLQERLNFLRARKGQHTVDA